MTVFSELRATLFADTAIALTKTATSPEEVSRFVNEATALAEREQPASMLLERGVELESEPGLTATDLAEFRFGSRAGVGLDAARAAWLRWYLRERGARLDERPAGRLTLFTGAWLAAVERPEAHGFDDALAGEVFVPWSIGYDGEVESRWLADHLTPVRDELHHTPDGDLPDRLRDALAIAPASLPVAPPLYALPLVAHPDKARRELAPDRFEPALALIRSATAKPPDELSDGDRQRLEWLCLGAAAFDTGLLVRNEPPGIVIWAGDTDQAAAAAAAAIP